MQTWNKMLAVTRERVLAIIVTGKYLVMGGCDGLMDVRDRSLP